jgi:integrase
MASVTKMTRQGGRERPVRPGEKLKRDQIHWLVRWKTPDRQSRRQVFGTEGEANAHAASMENAKNTNSYIDTVDGRMLIRVYAERWQSNQRWAQSTRESREGILRNYVIPRWGDWSLAAVNQEDVDAWVTWLSSDTDERKALEPGTVANIYQVLNSMYRSAARIIPINPCTGVKTPKKRKRLVRILGREQVKAIADVVGEYYMILIVLGVGAGLRISEALGCPVSAIDFFKKELSVTQQVTRTRAKGVSLGDPKTDASVRVIPLDDSAVAELVEWLRVHPRQGDELLVTDKNGNPIAENTFGQTFSRAAVKAGLPKGTRFHDLRHTFASTLIAAGCSPKAVQMALGHATIKETFDTYGHLSPNDDDRIRAAVGDFLRPQSDSPEARSVEGSS